jgi:COP9 signalosome complex subunit 6
MNPVSEAYPNYECLGWYSSGTQITQSDYVLHKQVRNEGQRAIAAETQWLTDSFLVVVQMSKYNERPLFLLLDPSVTSSKEALRDLPMTVYEEVIHVVGDKTTSEFVKTPYTVQADEAERLTVTYCARVVNTEESGSAIVAQYTSLLKSVQALTQRVAILHQFLRDAQSGKINISANGDQQILRDIKGVCQRMPIMNQEKFRADLLAV